MCATFGSPPLYPMFRVLPLHTSVAQDSDPRSRILKAIVHRLSPPAIRPPLQLCMKRLFQYTMVHPTWGMPGSEIPVSTDPSTGRNFFRIPLSTLKECLSLSNGATAEQVRYSWDILSVPIDQSHERLISFLLFGWGQDSMRDSVAGRGRRPLSDTK